MFRRNYYHNLLDGFVQLRLTSYFTYKYYIKKRFYRVDFHDLQVTDNQ